MSLGHASPESIWQIHSPRARSIPPLCAPAALGPRVHDDTQAQVIDHGKPRLGVIGRWIADDELENRVGLHDDAMHGVEHDGGPVAGRHDDRERRAHG